MPNRDYVTIVATLADAQPGKSGQFLVTQDTGNKYEWLGRWVAVSANGAAIVVTDDPSAAVVNTYVNIPTGVSSTLAAEAVAGDTQAELVDATGFAIGDSLQSDIQTTKIYPTITAIVTNTITLDRPIDFGGPVGTPVNVVNINMNVVGSLGSPIIFDATPPDEITGFEPAWVLTRIILTMTHGSAGDLGLFGDIPALTNGVLLRVEKLGVTRTLSNWKTNGDIKNDVYDVDFDTRSGGGGTFGTSARGTITRLNTTVDLDSRDDAKFQVVIQDDLSGLTTFTLKVQGRVSLNA